MALMHFREFNQAKWKGVRPAHRGTQVVKDGVAEGALVILWPGSATQVFYLTSWTLGVMIGAAGDWGSLGAYDAVPASWYRIALIRKTALDGGELAGNFWPPLEIPLNYTVRIETNAAGCFAYASVHGWIE